MHDNARLFPIQDSGGDFRAGRCSDGTQTLMGLWYGRVVACFFSPQGDFLRYEERATATPDSTKGADAVARRWWEEIGFRPAPITIKEFCYEPEGFAVHDGMGQFDEADYEDWEKTEAGFSADLAERRQGWIDDGLFVLLFDRDYYMSADGRVVST